MTSALLYSRRPLVPRSWLRGELRGYTPPKLGSSCVRNGPFPTAGKPRTPFNIIQNSNRLRRFNYLAPVMRFPIRHFPVLDTRSRVWYTFCMALRVHLPELKKEDCLPSILKYRAHVLDERMLNSPMGIAQRVEVEMIKRTPWMFGPNVDWYLD